METNENYDVAIIGGGVVGTALLYTLTEYTDIESIALIEQYDQIAPLNSNGRSNSQTLHFGEIETNYDLDKALQAKEAASMVEQYAKDLDNADEIIHKMQKMVLGVGDEVAVLEDRFDEFAEHYPDLEKWYREELTEREPALVDSRDEDEELLGLGVEEGYAVDYGKLAESFVQKALENEDTDVHVSLGNGVEDILETDNGYRITTEQGALDATVVDVAAGAHSLNFAQDLGYGEDLAILPVEGGFFYGPNMLNGKVYTVQKEKLPFAAVHGDPDVVLDEVTRFGPTAKPRPLLEKNNYDTFTDFLKAGSIWDSIKAVGRLMIDENAEHWWDRIDWETAGFMFKNLLYDKPFGDRIFLSDAQKIIPSLDHDDLEYGDEVGGIRPQVIDTNKGEMKMGEAKIDGDNILFNLTPSPGATKCLGNAEADAKKIVEFLDGEFDEEKHRKNLKPNPG